MVTIHTFDFQPLSSSLIERAIPQEGGVMILARKTGASNLKPFLVRKAHNLRAALRKFFLHEMDHGTSGFVRHFENPVSERIWVRIIAIKGEEHRIEVEKLLTEELFDRTGGPERDGDCFE